MASLPKGIGPILGAAILLAGIALLASLAVAGPGVSDSLGEDAAPTVQITNTPRAQISTPSGNTETATFALG